MGVERVGVPNFGATLDSIRSEAERNLFPPVDVLVNIGHSVVRGGDGRLVLSGMAQPIRDTGETFPDGGKKFVRTGVEGHVPSPAMWRKRAHNRKEEESAAIMGGGVLVNEAAVVFFNELNSRGQAPKLVVHTGGRPGYMERLRVKENEGVHMRKAFRRSVGRHAEYAEVLETGNKNTKGDMETALKETLDAGHKSLAVIAVGDRLPRCQAFLDELKGEHPEYGDLKVHLIPAERVVKYKAEEKGKEDQWNNFWSRFTSSGAYRKTYNDERAGYDRVVVGAYMKEVGKT